MTVIERTRTRLQRRTVLAMVASAIGFAGVARAQPTGDLVGLTVVDRETGEPLHVWRHLGRLYVAGEPGARYSLRITNQTGGRVLVVMSVDGVNILTGESASYGQRGYVFEPYQSYDVSGWRKSNTEVAAFTFAALSQSYAARTGRPADVGVIGIAAFKERAVAEPYVSQAPGASGRSRYDSEADVRDQAAAKSRAAPPSARGAFSGPVVAGRRQEEKLGTAHGAREWSAATTVTFERATRYPQLVRRIEYDTYDRLVAIGVVRPPWGPSPRPRPFPGSRGGYVPDPPGGY